MSPNPPTFNLLSQKTVATFGRLDLAFNNAGIEGQWKPHYRTVRQDWDSVININLKGTGCASNTKFSRCFKQGSPGAIVNMSSVAGLMGSAALPSMSPASMASSASPEMQHLNVPQKYFASMPSAPL